MVVAVVVVKLTSLACTSLMFAMDCTDQSFSDVINGQFGVENALGACHGERTVYAPQPRNVPAIYRPSQTDPGCTRRALAADVTEATLYDEFTSGLPSLIRCGINLVISQ